MELRAVIVECSTAFTGMCKLSEHCCTFLARQLQQQSGVSPGCCTSRGHGLTWPRRRQGRARPFLADSAVTLKPFPVDAPPGRPGPLPAGPPDHSPWQPPDCSPASGLRALCPAKQPTKAGWWLKLERASSLLSVPSTWPFFTPVFFPWFFCFSAHGRHHSASY